MICPHCEAPHDESRGRFCDACGLAIGGAPPERADPEATPELPRCGECGVPTVSELCPSCGRWTKYQPPEPLSPPPEQGAHRDLDEETIAARQAAAAVAAPLLVEEPDSLREYSWPQAAAPVELDAPRPLGDAAVPAWPEDATERDPATMPVVPLSEAPGDDESA